MSQDRGSRFCWGSDDIVIVRKIDTQGRGSDQDWSELNTLSKGKSASTFYWKPDGDGITIHAGPQVHLSDAELDDIISHFRGRGWFPLGASMTSPTPGGLGEYFRRILGKTPRYSSHFAAVLVRQGRLAVTDRGKAVYLKVM